MSYIDVQHSNLLPPKLTVGEARDFGLRFTSIESLVPARDASIDLVSQSHKVHILVEEPKAPVQIAKPATIELVILRKRNPAMVMTKRWWDKQ